MDDLAVMTMKRRLIMLALLLQLGACASWDAWQRAKVYRPTLVDATAWTQQLERFPGATAQVLGLPGDEQLHLIRLPATGAAQSVPVHVHVHVHVLYLHGTLRHALQNREKIEGIARNGLAVLAPDYRGWGASSPRVPDEASLFADAWAAWQLARQTPGPWVIYGHSMGSAVAVQLAQRVKAESAGDYCALVLESAFTSFDDVAQSVNPLVGALATMVGTQRMASIERIGQVHGPVWFLHGTADKTIPVALGEKLFRAAPAPKHWLALPKDHSDLQTDASGAYDQAWRQIRSGCEQPVAQSLSRKPSISAASFSG